MADDDATLGEQILNVAEAEVEAEIQPYGMSDDLGREAVASIGRPVSGLGGGHWTRLIAYPCQVDNTQRVATDIGGRYRVRLADRSIANVDPQSVPLFARTGPLPP